GTSSGTRRARGGSTTRSRRTPMVRASSCTGRSGASCASRPGSTWTRWLRRRAVSLYDDMGGEPALRAVLQALYDRLFDDVMVGFLFAGKDKAQLVEHQVRFTARFLGGPSAYQ